MTNIGVDDARYIVHNRKEVVQILSDLAKQKVMLNAVWNHGHDRTLTSVIHVDYDAGAVYLDVAASDAVNSSLLASHKIVFSAVGGIKIQWSSTSVKSAKLKDGMAFKIALPHDLLRVQRREFYRLTTPIVNRIPCRIPVEDRTVETALVDISAGGIGEFVVNPEELPLAVDMEFDHCKMDFPGIGMTDLMLRVRHITPMASQSDTVQHKIGMEYVNPSRGNQALIQRFIIKMEREIMELTSDQ